MPAIVSQQPCTSKEIVTTIDISVRRVHTKTPSKDKGE